MWRIVSSEDDFMCVYLFIVECIARALAHSRTKHITPKTKRTRAADATNQRQKKTFRFEYMYKMLVIVVAAAVSYALNKHSQLQ